MKMPDIDEIKTNIDLAWDRLLTRSVKIQKAYIIPEAKETRQLIDLINTKIDTLSRVSAIIADRESNDDVIRFEALLLGGLNTFDCVAEMRDLAFGDSIHLTIQVSWFIREKLMIIRSLLYLSDLYFKHIAPTHVFAKTYIETIEPEFLQWCNGIEKTNCLI